VAALTAYHRQRDVLAGVVLGLAIACKVTPALFLPYFLWKRSWKALGGCVLGLALFLWPGFVPALLMGWERNQHCHRGESHQRTPQSIAAGTGRAPGDAQRFVLHLRQRGVHTDALQ
jgi:hypothetical protein